MRQYRGIKECLGFFSEYPKGRLTCIQDNRHCGGMEDEEVWIAFDGDDIMLQTQFENNMNLSIFGDKLIYEGIELNDESQNIIPEIKEGTEPQRVLAEDGTENQEMIEKDFRIKELEARAHLGNLGSLERERKLTDELLGIVKDMVKRGEF